MSCRYCPKLYWHSLCTFVYMSNRELVRHSFLKKGLALWRSPRFFAFLFSVYLICSFQFTFSTSSTPRNLINSCLSMIWLLIVNFGSIRGMSCFLLGLWKKEYFDFLAFKESLLEVNYWLILANSSFIVENKFCMFEWV